MRVVKIGDRLVGDGKPCFVIAEIGINHNGSLKMAKALIDMAKECGCDAVKFQKRTVDVVYSKEELAKERKSVFGNTNGDLKRGLEFSEDEYTEIDRYCKEKGIMWFASCWDEGSVDFINKLCECEFILSSSLHGIILSDADHIPNMWIKLSDKVLGDGFKFRDYFRSVGKKEICEPLILDHFIPLKELLDYKSCWQEAVIDLDKLMSVCPFIK